MARYNKISEDIRKQIVDCRKQNYDWTRSQIATKFGISGAGVSKLLKAAGCPFIATGSKLKNNPNAVADFVRRTHTDKNEEKRLSALRASKTAMMIGSSGAAGEIEFMSVLAESRGGQCLGSYSGSKVKLNWKCHKGHEFEMIPNAVQQGQWCPHCAFVGPSRAQVEINDYICSVVPEYEIFMGNRTAIKPLELDIWIPELKFGLEYNGLYWHSDAHLASGRHLRKALACQQVGVSLLAVYEDEWKRKPELIKAMIRWRLHKFSGETRRGSELDLVRLDHNREFKDFFNRNHIDGHTKATYAMALVEDGVIRACASFRTNHNREFELARLATDYDFQIHGAAGKLLASAPRPLVSFSNNRLSSGNVYEKLGFEEVTVSGDKPSYWYTDLRQRIWRFKCRRINEPEILAAYPTQKLQLAAGVISERIFGDRRKLYRIEDYGHRKWLLKS